MILASYVWIVQSWYVAVCFPADSFYSLSTFIHILKSGLPPLEKKRGDSIIYILKTNRKDPVCRIWKTDIQEAEEEKIQEGAAWCPRKQMFIRAQTQRLLSQCTYLNMLSSDHTVKSNCKGSKDVHWRTSCTDETQIWIFWQWQRVAKSTRYHSLSFQVLFVL